jgi:hypothetical protein
MSVAVIDCPTWGIMRAAEKTIHRRSHMTIPESPSAQPNPKPLYDPGDIYHFRVMQKHEREFWKSSLGLAARGSLVAILWFTIYSSGLSRIAGPATSEEVERYFQIKAIYVSLDLASKILAVIGSLVIAVAVMVRGLADKGESAYGIDAARRRVFTYVLDGCHM